MNVGLGDVRVRRGAPKGATFRRYGGAIRPRQISNGPFSRTFSRTPPVSIISTCICLGAVLIENKPDDPQALDYAAPATPARNSSMSAIAAVLGTVAGLFGALMLFYGVAGIFWLVRDRRRVDGEDVFEVAMFNIIGGLSAFFAIRWIRSAIKGSGGTAGR